MTGTLEEKIEDVKRGDFSGVFHMIPADSCPKHNFKGWCPFDDGLGGEAVCTECGMGAMEYTLRSDL